MLYYIEIMFKSEVPGGPPEEGIITFSTPSSCAADAVRVASAYMLGRRDSNDHRSFYLQSVSTKKSRGLKYEAL